MGRLRQLGDVSDGKLLLPTVYLQAQSARSQKDGGPAISCMAMAWPAAGAAFGRSAWPGGKGKLCYGNKARA